MIRRFQELESELVTWKTLNMFRSVGVILGWLLVSLRPSTDLLYKHLKKLGGSVGKKKVVEANGEA